MRPPPILYLALYLSFAGSALAAPPKVAVRSRVTIGSWEPIAKGDLKKIVESAALEELSRAGKLQFETGGKPGDGDFSLMVEANLLDEAETLTVSLGFGPARRTDVPSLTAAETVALGKASRAEVVQKAEATARAAAKGLLASLEPQLSRVKVDPLAPPDDPLSTQKALPWTWGAVRIPRASLASAKDLYSKDHRLRQAALRELTSLALTDGAPRHALEQCALEHPEAEMRRGCLEALRPLSRRPGPTQRVVIEAFRKDTESCNRDEAIEQMLYFTGTGRTEAIQAWLEAASLGKPHGPLAELGDLPNLDLAIRKCLKSTARNEHRYDDSGRFGCIELLGPLSHQRRRVVLWPFISTTDKTSPMFLEGAGEREGSTGTPWARAIDALLEDSPGWDPALEEILWGRYQRTLSSHSLQTLCDYAVPSQGMVDRMLEVVQTAGAHCALRAVEKMGKKDPALGAKIKERLAEMQAMGNFAKNVDADDLGRTIKALSEPKR